MRPQTYLFPGTAHGRRADKPITAKVIWEAVQFAARHAGIEKPEVADRAISYNSCRNRHCPKCQSQARERWLEARRAELLPTPYAHVVFTLPHQLAPLALQNKQVLYGLLFRCSAQTLMEIAADPRRLGAEVGFFSVLHSWNQKLQHHPHVHCVA